MLNNPHLTLSEIDKNIIPALPDNASGLIRNIYNLKDKKLNDYEVEDLRILIGQEIILPYLIPMAIDVLQENILAEGNFYEGDLLLAVLMTRAQYWKEHKNEAITLVNLCQINKALIDDFDTTNGIRNKIKEAIRLFPQFG